MRAWRLCVVIAAAALLWCGCGGGASTTNSTNNQPVVTGYLPNDQAHGQWTWMAGANSVNANGVYGSKGVAAVGNTPGSRISASSWTANDGSLWLFGGGSFDSGAQHYFNDMWRYQNGVWTWMGGSNQMAQGGRYGTRGAASADNIPGARDGAASATGPDGSMWLYGGWGYDVNGQNCMLNDLWRYANGQWTWISGSKDCDGNMRPGGLGMMGVYGAKGVAAANNTPGSRQSGALWVDASGDVWVFGGSGYDAIGAVGSLNDLWRYHNGQWTWMSGANSVDGVGVYGTKGVAADANTPGAREIQGYWVDSDGALCLFGGDSYDSYLKGAYNDVWRYKNGQWTWTGGSQTMNAAGVFGVKGVAAASNMPGAHVNMGSVGDASHGFWIFSGYGYDDSGSGNLALRNDLWSYQNNQWTWRAGDTTAGGLERYGSQGSPDALNNPPVRIYPTMWIDKDGRVWLFGGYVNGNTYNDMWVYVP